jgi:uncharacterized membrane protein (DUF485 family)
MAESVVTQVKEVPGTLVSTVRRTPVLAIGIMFMVLFIVLLIEAYKPGLLTGPVRSLLTAIGVKSA